jgi:alpha-tubulin suppressor-like RCC1 family protein
MLLIEQLLARGASAPPPPPAEAAAPGFLETWGSNQSGQLGRPTAATTIFSWTAVSAGFQHTLAIRSDGKLFAWGLNNRGQLGNDAITGGYGASPNSPVQIGASSWTAVAAGAFHSLAIRSGGSLFAWGRNNFGQLGNGQFGDYGGPYGSSTQQSSPVQIGTSSWTAIAAGDEFSLAIRSGGNLFAWGVNTNGQLGLNNQTNRSSPTQVGTSVWTAISAGSLHTLALRSGGGLFSWGANTFGQCGRTELNPVASWTAIAGGAYHTLAIRSDSKLFAWGKNNYGQCGNGAPMTFGNRELEPVQIGTSNWIAVSVGLNHSLAIRSDNKLFSWGANYGGALGTEVYGSRRNSPLQIGTSNWIRIAAGRNHNLAIRSDSKLFAWGDNGYGAVGNGVTGSAVWEPVQIGTSNWTAIAAGHGHSLAIRSDSKLFAWGGNYFGNLGLGDNTNRSSPVQVGSSNWTAIAAGTFHSMAIRSGGSLFAWGDNGSGQLGLNDTTRRSSPVQIGSSAWTAIAAGGYHCLAIRSGGRLFSWGYSNNGQLGLPNNPYGYLPNQSSPVQVGTSNWTAVAAGRRHSLAIRSGGSLFVWGYNNEGNLGQGNLVLARSPVQIGGNPKASLISPVQVGSSNWTTVAAGTFHSLAIRSGGSLFAWGNNGVGQLGLNNTTNRSSPVQVGSSNWIRIAGATTASFAIRSDNKLFSWGNNFAGQLADSSFYGSRYSPEQIGTDNWSAITAAKGVQGNSPYPAAAAFAIRSDGRLFAWGGNENGQLGILSNVNSNDPNSQVPPPASVGGNQLPFDPNPGRVGTSSWTAVAAGNSHSVAIRSDGLLFTWGVNTNGQLGLDTGGTLRSSPVQIGTSSWVAVAAGAYHSLAIRSDNKLFSWGNNGNGQLGHNTQGYFSSTRSPVQIGTSNWTSVKAGWLVSMAIRSDGRLFSWGYNGNPGRLGLGVNDTQQRSSPTQVGTSSWTAVSVGQNHSLAIRSDGKLFAWGFNGQGQLGNGASGQNAQQRSPVQIGNSSWVAVAAGIVTSLAIRSDNKLFSWGRSDFGEFGNGTYGYFARRSSPVQVGTSNWSAVSTPPSDNHVLAITSDGKLFAWGRNNFGQLGISGTPQDYNPSPVQVGASSWTAVAAGKAHVVAIAKKP